MARSTFCWCVPTRLGVLIMAPLTCALAICSTIMTIYGLSEFWNDVSKWQRVFLCTQTAMTIVVTLASIFGFIGAIIQHQNCVQIYSNVLYSLWICLIASGILSTVFIYKDQESLIWACVHSQDESWSWCKGAFNMSAAVSIALWGCIIIIGLWLTTIVRRYAKQLMENDSYPSRPADPNDMQRSYSYNRDEGDYRQS